MYLVAYLDWIPKRLHWDIGTVLGTGWEPSPLPFESAPFATREEAERELARLPPLDIAEDPVFIQPERDELPQLSQAEVLALVWADARFKGYAEEAGISPTRISIRLKEEPRCWLGLARIPRAKIPPGWGFLVDKHTRTVLIRRWIDLSDYFK